MSTVDSGRNEKSVSILSDEALDKIAAGFDGDMAESLATDLLNQLNSERGNLQLEAGYTKEEVEAAFKAAFRGLKPRGTPAA
jgi:hypothetical protein